jgi:hypothetical protein
VTALAAALVISLSACTTTLSDAPARKAAPSRQTDELTAMLLSVEEIRRIVGIGDLDVEETYEKFLDYVEFSPEQCAGVLFNTIARAYRNSGYVAVSGMVVQTPEQDHWIDEGVVRFASAADAHRYVAESEQNWLDCAGSEVRQVPNEDTDVQTWSIGETERLADPGGLMVRTRRVDLAGEVCAHAMADRSSLVIDVVVCGPRVDGEAVTILNQIAKRPPV